MALSISEILDKLIAREDTSVSISAMVPVVSAVGQVLTSAGSRIRPMSQPVLAYSTLDDATFSTWDNSSAKTSQALGGDVGEVTAFTAYAIVAYPNNYDVDVAAFPQEFAMSMANGFARYIDDRVLNTASTGIIAVASGVANTYPTTVSGATTYQLYTDLVKTMGLVLADGYRVNGIVGEIGEETDVLNTVSTTGQPIFITGTNGEISRVVSKPYASTIVNLANGARFVAGDWSKLVVGIYKNLEYKKFESGSVNIGGTEYNLIERNMVAVRAEARVAFKVTKSAAFAYLYDA